MERPHFMPEEARQQLPQTVEEAINAQKNFKSTRERPNPSFNGMAHADLAAVLAGTKPVAIITGESFDSTHYPDAKLTQNLFAEAQKRGYAIVRGEIREHTHSHLNPGQKSLDFYIAKDQASAKELMQLESETGRQGFESMQQARRIGELLGYSKESIDTYIQKKFSGKD